MTRNASRGRRAALLLPLLLAAPPAQGVRWPSPLSNSSDSRSDHAQHNVSLDRPPVKDHCALSPDLPSPEDHLVYPLRHFSGHLPATTADRQLFYSLFEPPDAGINTPLLIWLNRAPACSSMDRQFLEVGPFRLDHDGTEWKVRTVEESWLNVPAWLLFVDQPVDQPVGTGLNFTRDKHHYRSDSRANKHHYLNDSEANEDFYAFLLNFLDVYQEYFRRGESSVPIFFSGENHAKYYIPSMMDHMLRTNEEDPKITIQLGDAAFENGWIDPFDQYGYAYASGQIDASQWSVLKQKGRCQKNLAQGWFFTDSCLHLLDDVIKYSSGKGGHYKISSYDDCVREKKGAPAGHQIPEAYVGYLPGDTHKKEADVDPPNQELPSVLNDVIDDSSGKGGHYKISSYDDRVREKKGAIRIYPAGHQIPEAYLGYLPGDTHKKKADVDPPNQELPSVITEEVLRSIQAKA